MIDVEKLAVKPSFESESTNDSLRRNSTKSMLRKAGLDQI